MQPNTGDGSARNLGRRAEQLGICFRNFLRSTAALRCQIIFQSLQVQTGFVIPRGWGLEF